MGNNCAYQVPDHRDLTAKKAAPHGKSRSDLTWSEKICDVLNPKADVVREYVKGWNRSMADITPNVIRVLGASALALALTACGGSGGSNSTSTTGASTVASLSGNFVFSAVGTDPSDGDYAVAGSFVADGKGNVTSGVADYNLGSGVDENVPLTGTYTVSATGAVVVSLTDGGSVKDTITTIVVPASGSAPISSFDGTGTGTLYAQVTTGFTPAGTYSFTVGGEGNNTVTGSGTVVAGAGGTFTSGSLTYQDGVTLTNYTNPSGFVYTPKANGRGQASLVGDNLSYYVIGPKQVEFIGLDARALLILPSSKM
jgi:hypothetical protein